MYETFYPLPHEVKISIMPDRFKKRRRRYRRRIKRRVIKDQSGFFGAMFFRDKKDKHVKYVIKNSYYRDEPHTLAQLVMTKRKRKKKIKIK